MDPQAFFQAMMGGTKILRPPRHNLSTFGTTTLHYVLLSEIPGDLKQCRLREGKVTAERPQIITPDLWQKRFEGFGEEAEAYKEVFEQMLGESFRSLEYRFKNDLEKTSVELGSLAELADRASHVMQAENAPRTALLQGPDQSWGISIMKFIVNMSMRSFSTNVSELNERGLFEPEKRAEAKQRVSIEQLFKNAQQNPAAIGALANALKETGHFAEYEDRFFSLVQRAD